MSLPVVTVAAGGLPVVDVTAIAPKAGMPVIEAANFRGRAVTKVVGKPGMPVVYETAGAVAGGGTGTFDPAVKTTHAVLSGGNLVSTWDAASNGTSWVRGTNSYTSGKRYFRFTLTTLGGGGCGIGIADSTALPDVDNLTVTTKGIIQWSNASCYQNSITVINWITPSPQGTVYEIAVDVGNSLIWFKRSDLPAQGWNNSSGAADPATGTGGITLTASGALYIAAMAQSTVSVGTLDLVGGTPPAGFGHW